MPHARTIDGGRPIDWGRTSPDYATYRPGPPESFYRRLAAFGVGVEGQRILDLGSGTGLLARSFASQGLEVAGIDVSEAQVTAAREQAIAEGLTIDFRVAPAESLPFPAASFDVATANQCWLYFDHDRAVAELRRVLRAGGIIMISHFSWLPRLDPIARESERLVLRYNPKWSGADFDGRVVVDPSWKPGVLRQRAMFYYDEAIPFTRESWRGRVRASRGIGASLSAEEVEAFDRDHEERLRSIAPPQFTILHRIDARIVEFI